VHEHLQPPLRLDAHSTHLVARYAAHRAALNRAGAFLGRSRLATLSADLSDRAACTYLGRCLWGCPHEALYTPSVTLEQCRRFAGFRYVPASYVSHFLFDRARRVTGVAVGVRPDAVPETVGLDALVLAAGAISSARILLESVWRGSGERVVLPGLMDNQQILVPFVNLGMIGQEAERSAYQYHQVCLGLQAPDPAHYIHAQLTTLKTATVHPVIQGLPFDLRTATTVFRCLRSALGIANVNLHDTRRPGCTVTLEPGDRDAPGTLVLTYAAAPDDAQRIHAAQRRVRAVLRQLGCVVPPGMSRVRPKGASVHYAGLVPMGGSGGPLTASPECRSNDFANLWLADGITFPFLPAKNITFTLMANAVRIGHAAF